MAYFVRVGNFGVPVQPQGNGLAKPLADCLQDNCNEAALVTVMAATSTAAASLATTSTLSSEQIATGSTQGAATTSAEQTTTAPMLCNPEQSKYAECVIKHKIDHKHTQMDETKNLGMAELPSTFHLLTSLTALVLDGNKLVDIDAVQHLTNLVDLSVQNNRLVLLKPGIAMLTKLKTLTLKNNRLRSVDVVDFSNFLELEHVDLGKNMLRTFPSSVCRLPKVRSIDVSNNYLTNLPNCVAGLLSLQSLYAAKNELLTLPQYLGGTFPRAVSKITTSVNLAASQPPTSSASTTVVRVRRNASSIDLPAVSSAGTTSVPVAAVVPDTTIAASPRPSATFAPSPNPTTMNLLQRCFSECGGQVFSLCEQHGNCYNSRCVGCRASHSCIGECAGCDSADVQACAPCFVGCLRGKTIKDKNDTLVAVGNVLPSSVATSTSTMNASVAAVVRETMAEASRLSSVTSTPKPTDPPFQHNVIRLEVRDAGLGVTEQALIKDAVATFLTHGTDISRADIGNTTITAEPDATNDRITIETAFLPTVPAYRIAAAVRALQNISAPALGYGRQELHILFASVNYLTSLPQGLKDCPQLRTLEAHHNKLSKFELSLPNVRVLSLGNNLMTEFPPLVDASASELQILDLSSNFLTAVPDVVKSLTNLQTLFVHSNRIERVSPFLADLPLLGKLKTLTMEGNPSICAISFHPNFRRLIFSGGPYSKTAQGTEDSDSIEPTMVCECAQGYTGIFDCFSTRQLIMPSSVATLASKYMVDPAGVESSEDMTHTRGFTVELDQSSNQLTDVFSRDLIRLQFKDELVSFECDEASEDCEYPRSLPHMDQKESITMDFVIKAANINTNFQVSPVIVRSAFVDPEAFSGGTCGVSIGTNLNHSFAITMAGLGLVREIEGNANLPTNISLHLTEFSLGLLSKAIQQNLSTAMMDFLAAGCNPSFLLNASKGLPQDVVTTVQSMLQDALPVDLNFSNGTNSYSPAVHGAQGLTRNASNATATASGTTGDCMELQQKFDATVSRYTIARSAAKVTHVSDAGTIQLQSQGGGGQYTLNVHMKQATRNANVLGTLMLVASETLTGEQLNICQLVLDVRDCYDGSAVTAGAATCGQHGRCSNDTNQYDGEMPDCICHNPNEYEGRYCERQKPKEVAPKASNDKKEEDEKNGTLIAASICGVVLLIGGGVALSLYCRNQKKLNKPYNFTYHIRQLQGLGLVPDGYSPEKGDSAPAYLKQPKEIYQRFIRYDFGKAAKLGEGNFGSVFKAKLETHALKKGSREQYVAVKSIRPDAPVSAREALFGEAVLMTQFDHKNVLQILGVISRRDQSMVILEFCENGSLFDLLRGDENQIYAGLTLNKGMEIAVEVAHGMAYLSAKKYVHRDIAARNILVTEDYQYKIADFGLSRHFKNGVEYYRMQTEGLIPLRWSSIEVLKDGKFSVWSDVWSYGVLLAEIFSGAARPYSGMTDGRILTMLEAGGRLQCPQGLESIQGEDIYDNVMLVCWAVEPTNRPSFDDILRYFENREDDEIALSSQASESFNSLANANRLREAVAANQSPYRAHVLSGEPQSRTTTLHGSASTTLANSPLNEGGEPATRNSVVGRQYSALMPADQQSKYSARLHPDTDNVREEGVSQSSSYARRTSVAGGGITPLQQDSSYARRTSVSGGAITPPPQDPSSYARRSSLVRQSGAVHASRDNLSDSRDNLSDSHSTASCHSRGSGLSGIDARSRRSHMSNISQSSYASAAARLGLAAGQDYAAMLPARFLEKNDAVPVLTSSVSSDIQERRLSSATEYSALHNLLPQTVAVLQVGDQGVALSCCCCVSVCIVCGL